MIGCPGAGKTTFSEKLAIKTGLPLFHLDAVWHKPDRTHISRAEFDEWLQSTFYQKEWIIDGNYSRTVEVRLQNCDTVFLFDLPTELCIEGAVRRLGKKRKDLPWTDTELDPRFLEEIENFSTEALPDIYRLIEKYKENRQVIIFKTREEADQYLENYGDK